MIDLPPLIYPLAAKPPAVVRHDPKHNPKGGQFKWGVDIPATPGTPVYAAVGGKIAHVYVDRTKCVGATLASQFTINEEYVAKGDRHLTGRRVFYAHVTPVAGLGSPTFRRVTAGQLVGYVAGPFLHVAVKTEATLAALLAA